MLNQLLAIKKRREGRLRQQISLGNQSYEHLQHRLVSLDEERKTLQQAWLLLGQKGKGKLARDKLHMIQRELEEHFQRDKALKEECVNVKAECEVWLVEKEQLKQRIKQSRIDQEKLTIIIDESIDAH